MCLGVPGRILAINGQSATVDFWGVTRTVRLDIVDEPVAVGDYILNHVGYAIRRIPASEVEATMALYDELLAHLESEAEADLMAADVASELGATGAIGVGAATETDGGDHGR